MTIGQRIREVRKNAGLTQRELAEKSGTATGTIQQYELGKRRPRLEQLQRIADTLDVTVGYLQGYESMDLKKLVDAFTVHDYHTMEQLMGLPEGSIVPIPAEEMLNVEERMQEIRHDSEINQNKLNTVIRLTYTHFTNSDYLAIRNIIVSLSKLNDDGLQKAVERVDELTEIPRYRRQEAR